MLITGGGVIQPFKYTEVPIDRSQCKDIHVYLELLVTTCIYMYYFCDSTPYTAGFLRCIIFMDWSITLMFRAETSFTD